MIGLFGILVDSLRDVLHRVPRSRSEFAEHRPDSVREAIAQALTEDAQYGRFNRYTAVGLVGVGINEGTLFLVTGMVGYSYVIGGLVARIVSVAFNFVLNDAWTWRSRGEAGLRSWLDRCWKYIATRIVGIAIGLTALIAFVELGGLHYLVANLLAIAVGAAWGYASSEFWVWRDGSKPPLSDRLPSWARPWRTSESGPTSTNKTDSSTHAGDPGSSTTGDVTPAYNGGGRIEDESESDPRPESSDGFQSRRKSNDDSCRDDDSGDDDSELRSDGGTAPEDESDGRSAPGDESDGGTAPGDESDGGAGPEDGPERETESDGGTSSGDDRSPSGSSGSRSADDGRTADDGTPRWRLERVAGTASGVAGRARRDAERYGRTTRTRLAAVDRGTWLVLTLAAALATWFSWYTIQLYQGFALTGADFGSYVHMFSSTLHGEGFLKQGKYRINHPEQVYWGAHFTLTLLLYLPVYALFPAPETLLIAKSVVLASSVVMLWFMAREMLQSQYLAGLVVVSYAFNPFLWSAWAFDFQEQTLIPLFVFGAYYAYVKRYRVAFLVLLLLALLTNEFVIPLIGGFVLALGVSSYRSDEFHERLPTIVAALVLVAFAHVLAGAVIAYFSRYGGIPVRVVAVPFQPLLDGPRVSMGEVIAVGLTNPHLILDSLLVDIDSKLLYFLALMIPVGLLSLTDEHTVFALVPFVGFAWVFGSRPAYWSFAAHYPLYFLPFVYIGAVHTLDRITLPTIKREWFGRLLVYVILLNVVAAALVWPLNMQEIPATTEQHDRVQAAIDEVPEDAYLLVQNNHFPHVADRPDVTFLVAEYEIEQYQEQFGPLTPEYVIYDTRTSGLWPDLVISAFDDRLGSEYGVYRYEKGTWVFKRGYQGDPQPITGDRSYERFEGDRSYEPAELETRSGTLEGDRIVGDDEAGVIWFGPYEILPSGTYTVSFEVEVEGEGRVGHVDVSAEAGEEIIEEETLTPTDGVETVELTFSTDRPLGDVEFRGIHDGEGTIELESVELVAEDSPASTDPTASPGRFDLETFDPGTERNESVGASEGVGVSEDVGAGEGVRTSEGVGTDGEIGADEGVGTGEGIGVNEEIASVDTEPKVIMKSTVEASTRATVDAPLLSSELAPIAPEVSRA